MTLTKLSAILGLVLLQPIRPVWCDHLDHFFAKLVIRIATVIRLFTVSLIDKAKLLLSQQ